MTTWPLGGIIATGALALLITAVAAYYLGRRHGAREADGWWWRWTGLARAEVERHAYDTELRELQRRIGRPADEWPESSRED